MDYYQESYTHDMTHLLERDAATFLRYIQDPINALQVKRWFEGESKTYRGYYSPPTHLLMMLCGKKAKIYSYENYFGSQIPKGIPESLALEIFEEFTRYPMDACDENYYQEDLQTFLQNSKYTHTHRINNDALKARIIKHFNLTLDPTPQEDTLPSPALPAPPAPSCSDPYPPEGPPVDSNTPAETYHYPHPAAPFSIVPPTYDGHFQNFVDNMDEYYREMDETDEEDIG